MGLDALVATVNREIYPKDLYPYGQWDYQHNYEINFEKTIKALDANVDTSAKIFYTAGNPANYGQPSTLTASTSKQGGWFGDGVEAPDIPLEKTLFKDDEDMYTELRDGLAKNGWFGPCAYYLNHNLNRTYTEKSTNGGVLDFPVLFIDAKWDIVCTPSVDRLGDPMKKFCKDLTWATVEAGHWVALEKPMEVNAAITRWLATKVDDHWPGYFTKPLVSMSKI